MSDRAHVVLEDARMRESSCHERDIQFEIPRDTGLCEDTRRDAIFHERVAI